MMRATAADASGQRGKGRGRCVAPPAELNRRVATERGGPCHGVRGRVLLDLISSRCEISPRIWEPMPVTSSPPLDHHSQRRQSLRLTSFENQSAARTERTNQERLKMCGGAILAELIPSAPARRVKAGQRPAGGEGKQKQRRKADDFEAAFREFDDDSARESSQSGSAALPDFSWQGMSPALDSAAVDLGGSSKRLRTEEEAASPRSASESKSDALFDAFLFGDQFNFFGGGEYQSLDSLFSADAVQGGAAADEGMGLWSFDDDCLVEDTLSF
ncbi:hypothetical protein EJB05_07806, partial [Eragrostis curvula]